MKTVNLFMALMLVVGLALLAGPVPVAQADSLSGGNVKYFYDGSQGTLNLSDGQVWVLTFPDLDLTSFTGALNLNIGDEGCCGWEKFHIQIHAHFYGTGGHLLQAYDKWFSSLKSSHGLNPGDGTNPFDVRVVMYQNNDDTWHITPYIRLDGGTWTPFFDGPYDSAEAFDLSASMLMLEFHPTGSGTVNFTAPTADGVDLSTVYVDDDWAGTALTTEVGSGKFFGINAFATIQEGVDAVYGSTVNVAAGTYTPGATINVNKSVTLRGPQAGVDPRPSKGTTRTPGSASEAIVDGLGTLSRIFRITASDVVLDGLEIRNATGDMIDSPSGAGISNVALRYNIIRNALGDEGIQLRDCTNCVVEFNHVFDIAQDGINLCCGSTGGTIQSNEVHSNSSENAAIYVYEATHTTVQCNLVYDVFDNDGIKLGSKEGGDAALTGGSIRYNVVHGTVQDGISVYMSDMLVDGNEVYNSTSENGAIYLAWEISNITIVDNNVHDNTLATWKWGDPGGIMIGTAVNAASVTVNNNNITNNSPNGVTNKAAAQLDATGNWWGAADGPSGPGGSGSGDGVSTNVDFSSYLAGPAQPQGENPCEESTAITLASFTAEAGAGGVTLAWETGTELDNAGFNLYRAMTKDGPWTQINETLIAAQGDAVAGAGYSFADTPGYGTFYYKLEDVDYYGASTLHGPVKATVARPFRSPLYRPRLPEF